MDVGSFVQENKRWLLGCATGLVVFFVARSIVGSIYDPGPDRRAARGVVQNAQTSEVYDRSGLSAAIAEQDELQKARAGLESEIGFRRGAEFSFEGKGLSPDEFLGKVGRERKLAILKAASERDVQVDPNRDLTWPQAPNGLDEIRAALFGPGPRCAQGRRRGAPQRAPRAGARAEARTGRRARVPGAGARAVRVPQ